MPKRKHRMAQASLDNLIPAAHKLTKEDQAKGGRTTAQRRSAQAAIERLLNRPLTPKQVKQYELMGQKLDGTETGIDMLMAGMMRAGIDGSEKCARLILEYAGEKSASGGEMSLLDFLKIIPADSESDEK